MMALNSLHSSVHFTFVHSPFSEDFLDLTIYKGQHFQTTQHLDMMWLLRETRNILPGNSKGAIQGRKMFFRWLAKHTLLGVQDIREVLGVNDTRGREGGGSSRRPYCLYMNTINTPGSQIYFLGTHMHQL